jgi:cytochrome P450
MTSAYSNLSAGLLDADFLADPFDRYRQLRTEAPVFHVERTDLYYVTRFEDVMHVTRHPEIFSNATRVGEHDLRRPEPELMDVMKGGWEHVDTLQTADDPEHARYRRFMVPYFTASKMKALEGEMGALATDLIDHFERSGRFEVVADYAMPLPVAVIVRLLGLRNDDGPTIHKLTTAFHEVQTGTLSIDERREAARAWVALQRLLVDAIDERAARPTEDLIGVLAAAGHDGLHDFTLEEQLSLILQICVAGHSTITGALTNAVHVMLSTPGLQGRLRAEPALIEGFIEESLRLEGPVHRVLKRVLSDTEVAGVQIPRGARVAVVYASASRDESVFPDSDEFRLERDVYKRQMAFGRGIHLCLGAAMARVELGVAIACLLGRLPNMRLTADNDNAYLTGGIVRRRKRLRVEFDPVSLSSNRI